MNYKVVIGIISVLVLGISVAGASVGDEILSFTEEDDDIDTLSTAASSVANTDPAVKRAIKDWANDQRLTDHAKQKLQAALKDEKTRNKVARRISRLKDQYPQYDPALLLILYGSEDDQVDVLIKYKEGFKSTAGTSSVTSIDQKASIEYVFNDINIVSIHNLNQSPVKELGNLRQVERVYLNRKYSIPQVEPTDDSSTQATVDGNGTTDWDIKQTDVESLWKQGIKGQGMRIAVLDTGIDDTHPDLDDIPQTGEEKVVAEKVFISPIYTDDPPSDGHGHGTHVAGIIAGTGEASNGKYMGVAPRAKLVVSGKDFVGIISPLTDRTR